MYTRKSRLSSYKQSRLIEHFVAGTTARAAAQIVGVQANTAITFYMSSKEKSKRTRAIWVVFAKVNEAEALQVKSLSLGY